MNQLDFAGRHAVVTGGATGLGFGIAKRLLASGGSVTIWDRDGEAATKAAWSLGAKAFALTVDVTQQPSVAKAVAATLAQARRIDALVNSAGITGPNTKVADYPVDAWRQVMEVNLNGLFLCCRAVVPVMQQAGLRPHRQHRLGRGQGRQPQRQRLQREQGGADRPHQIARQGTRRHGDLRQLRDAGGGEDRDLRPDDAGPHRIHALQDPDGPLRQGRGNRGDGRLALHRRLLLLHRRGVRSLGRPVDLLISMHAHTHTERTD